MKSTALVIRKNEDGSYMMFGKALKQFNDIIDSDEEEYLFIGEVVLRPKHIFKGYKNDAGNTPDNILLNGGLDYKNYKEKIL